MNWNEYGSFIVEETKNLLAIDSPSGMTKKAAEHVMTRFEALGYAPQMTRKDGVLVCLGGVDKENGLLLEAHMDTLGGMVCQIKADGRLKITPIGGLRAENVETENCRVVTKFDGVIEGTAQLVNASTHVNEKLCLHKAQLGHRGGRAGRGRRVRGRREGPRHLRRRLCLL